MTDRTSPQSGTAHQDSHIASKENGPNSHVSNDPTLNNFVLPGISTLSHDLPVTPTFANAELNSGSQFSLSMFTQGVLDFDTAADMLMNNDINGNNTTNNHLNGVMTPQMASPGLNSFFASPKYQLPSIAKLGPPSGNTNVEFDAIGSLLLSPTNGKSNGITDLFESNSMSNSISPFLGMNSGFNSHSLDKSPKIPREGSPILPALKSFGTPVNSGSFTATHNSTNLTPTTASLLSIPLSIPSPVTSAAVSSGEYIGLGLLPQQQVPSHIYKSDLLSNTEALALESFLDSIANEQGGIKGKRKLDENEETFTESKKSKTKEISSVKKLTKEERKNIHNMTEQKRRDQIKDEFNKLHEMILNSQFDLKEEKEDENVEKIPGKKRKRKKKIGQNVNKPLKKFEVLNMAIKEIQILHQKISELKT